MINTSMKTPGTGHRYSSKMTTGKLKPVESTLDSQNYTDANKKVMVDRVTREQAQSMASNKKRGL